MTHPSDGALRRFLDQPEALSDSDRRHIDGCASCQERVAGARIDRDATASALAGMGATTADVESAWTRFSAGAKEKAGVSDVVVPITAARRRRRLRLPVVVAAGALVIVTGAGVAAAANDWLPIFSTQSIAPVTFSMDDLSALPDLSAIGTVVESSSPSIVQAADAEAAAAASGIRLPRLTALPNGVTGDPTFHTVGAQSATVALSSSRMAAVAGAAGGTAPSAPPGIDGSSLRVTVGPGVAEVWTGAGGLPSLVVARLVAPTVESSGAPLNVVRDYLLSVPGVPAELANQLRAATSDGTTLPIPVPEDQATTSTADVSGTRATLIQSRDQSMSAVVWVENGMLNLVGGPLSTDEVLDVARAF